MIIVLYFATEELCGAKEDFLGSVTSFGVGVNIRASAGPGSYKQNLGFVDKHLANKIGRLGPYMPDNRCVPHSLRVSPQPMRARVLVHS